MTVRQYHCLYFAFHNTLHARLSLPETEGQSGPPLLECKIRTNQSICRWKSLSTRRAGKGGDGGAPWHRHKDTEVCQQLDPCWVGSVVTGLGVRRLEAGPEVGGNTMARQDLWRLWPRLQLCPFWEAGRSHMLRRPLRCAHSALEGPVHQRCRHVYHCAAGRSGCAPQLC